MARRPPASVRSLIRWRVASSTIIHVALSIWMLGYFVRHRQRLASLAYINAPVPGGINPAQSKNELYLSLKRRDTSLAALYPRFALIPAALSARDKMHAVYAFMRKHRLKYPIVLKPDRGCRSIGAYRLDSEEGLRFILERAHVDYIAQEYCDRSIEVGLFFVRSTDSAHPSQYGIALKHSAYVARISPHDGVVSLETRFLCQDMTQKLTDKLKRLIDRIADGVPFDMGRIDAKVDSVHALFEEPDTLRILEINTGFDVADLHTTDLRRGFFARMRMVEDKWLYAFRLAAAHYDRAREKKGFGEVLRSYLSYGRFLASIKKQFKS